VLRIAHRGLPRRLPENTIPSFLAALALGADGIELDVHETSDGVVVVHHDPALPDGSEIRRSTSEVLRSKPTAEGGAIPTLDDVCRRIGTSADLFVEIKGEGIEESVVAVLDRHDCRAAIHSFDHGLIGRLGRRGVTYRLGLLFEEAPLDPKREMESRGALDLWPERGLLTKALLDDVHAFGGRVIPWTVNDPAEAATFAAWGVDGVCTDDVSIVPPDRARRPDGGGSDGRRSAR
jgi:glycerophosphoryl diester phosphodiesterase